MFQVRSVHQLCLGQHACQSVRHVHDGHQPRVRHVHVQRVCLDAAGQEPVCLSGDTENQHLRVDRCERRRFGPRFAVQRIYPMRKGFC